MFVKTARLVMWWGIGLTDNGGSSREVWKIGDGRYKLSKIQLTEHSWRKTGYCGEILQTNVRASNQRTKTEKTILVMCSWRKYILLRCIMITKLCCAKNLYNIQLKAQIGYYIKKEVENTIYLLIIHEKQNI